MSTTHEINLQGATDDTQSTDIAAIKLKTDKITITQNQNLDNHNSVISANILAINAIKTKHKYTLLVILILSKWVTSFC